MRLGTSVKKAANRIRESYEDNLHTFDEVFWNGRNMVGQIWVDGVLDMTRNNDTFFCYTSKSHIFACQRLTNGNTFIGECDLGRLLEVSPDGKIVKHYLYFHKA